MSSLSAKGWNSFHLFRSWINASYYKNESLSRLKHWSCLTINYIVRVNIDIAQFSVRKEQIKLHFSLQRAQIAIMRCCSECCCLHSANSHWGSPTVPDHLKLFFTARHFTHLIDGRRWVSSGLSIQLYFAWFLAATESGMNTIKILQCWPADWMFTCYAKQDSWTFK